MSGTEYSDLPDLKRGEGSDGRPSRVTDLLSYLGPLNPLGHKISGNDTVWLFDNTAYRSARGGWQAEFVVAVFDKNTGLEVSTVVAKVAEKLGLAKGDNAEATIRKRLFPFMESILPGRLVKVDFAQQTKLRLGPGGRNGISSDTRRLPNLQGGQVVSSIAEAPQATDGIKEMKTFYAEPEGWGLISDIDDTIKITQTNEKLGILKSTFISDPAPIAGMPELYKFIQQLITPSSPFFYLSASPYNLYEFLSDFRQRFYPQGTMILRDASWMNLAGFLSSLTVGTKEYKVDRMTKIHSWLPKRKMICFGDSTQYDPESYGEIYRKYPGWIRLIIIRKVTGIAESGLDKKNETSRFETAFKDIPKGVWYVFEDPKECYQKLKDVVGGTE